ncbi:autotransporter assembly complex protein TamA [Palleronia sp. KMU-117]|uniref:autotransporter assembly complex protein TamA n=1 Tax=Palleronia sp. KMU-117 TaxID=3434108 RepID=UPI003D71C79C
MARPVLALEPIVFGVTGGEKALREALIDASLVVDAREAGTEDPQEILSAARSDYARFVGLLYERGYFAPVVSIRIDGREAAEISPLEVPARADVVDIRIAVGPPYVFGRASVAPLAPETELPKDFATGQPARTPVIAAAGRTAIRSWREAGFAKADVSGQRIVADHADRRVDADLTVAAGPRVTFGRLNVSGNRDVSSARIVEIAGLPTGEVFSPAAVDTVNANLRRTGTFRAVVLSEADTVAPDGTMDMNLVVSESLPRRFGFGAEYSTNDGLEVTGFWLHRNFLGGAERLELNLDVTGISASDRDIGVSFGARFTRPATPDPRTDLFILARLAQLEEIDYSGPRLVLGFGFQRRYSDRLTAEIAAALDLSQIDSAFGRNDYAMVELPARVTYDARDDLLNPTSGYFVDARVIPYAGFIDTVSGVQFLGDGRLYFGFGAEKDVVLAGRFQIGALAGPSLSQAPPFYLFYSGGSGTVRGQPYQSLGVDLGDGLRSGGRSFLGSSLEVRGQVTDNIQLVGFYDWGYIGADAFADGSGNTQSGAGIGVRYLTPIGPLRVDVGTPLAGPPTSATALLYIGIGQAF